MAIRLGFSGNSKFLENCATDKTVSVEAVNRLQDNKKIAKLEKVARENISNTLKVLESNKKNGIKVYGLSNRLFPLANYPGIEYFRYIDLLKGNLLELGEYIKENDFRVNVILEGTIILNSLSDRLYEDAVKNIKYQNVLLNSMGLDEKYKIIVNFGGAYINKEDSIDRFKATLEKLDDSIKKRLVINNEDNSIDENVILDICSYYSIPYFLNIKSKAVNNSLVEKSLKSWDSSNIPALLGLNSESDLFEISKLNKNVDIILNKANKNVVNLLKNQNF